MIQEKSFRRWFIVILLGVLVILSFFLLKPILLSIVAGILFAYIFHPLYIQIRKIIREKNISALIVVLIILLVIFLPIWFFAPILVKQVFEMYSQTQKINFVAPIQQIFPSLFSTPEFSTQVTVALNNFFSKITQSVLSKVINVLTDLPSIIIQGAVILFTFFFALRDWDSFKVYIKSLSPFTPAGEEKIFEKFSGITKSVIYGQILVGIVQGVMTGIGLFIFQGPSPLLLTSLAIFLGVIPMVGTWPIWLASVIYMLIIGKTTLAILFLAYCLIFVAWIDNILRAWITSKSSKVHPGVILIGMLGGLFLFGILGLILGPLILAYLLVILDFYKEKKFSELFRQD